jgi:hypothetical protein
MVALVFRVSLHCTKEKAWGHWIWLIGIACMEITEMKRQLHNQEFEYKSLVRSCKVSIFTYIMEKMMLGCWQIETKDSKDEIRK